MKDYQRAFLTFALERGVLQFGEFTLKSGRKSPYFFNTGLFNDGVCLTKLGQYYAQALVDSGLDVDMLFGPAYKGIPLVSSLAIALAEHHQQSYPVAFDRKEAKDHGEGGMIVGAALQGKVLIVDDVISAGTSVRHSVDVISRQGSAAIPCGVLIALDRQEKGEGERSTIQEIEEELSLPVVSIVSFVDIVAYLEEQGRADDIAAMQAYRKQYGC